MLFLQNGEKVILVYSKEELSAMIRLLHDYQDISLRKIAKILGISYGTVRRYHRDPYKSHHREPKKNN